MGGRGSGVAGLLYPAGYTIRGHYILCLHPDGEHQIEVVRDILSRVIVYHPLSPASKRPLIAYR